MRSVGPVLGMHDQYPFSSKEMLMRIDGWLYVLTFLATLGAGVMAGVFFVFSTSLMNALARLPPARGIATMQSINVAVINPLFLLTLMGTAALSAVLAVAAVVRWGDPGSGYLLAGSAVYLAGCIFVTGVCNVPRNNELAALDPTARDASSRWNRYVTEWTRWNHVRTLAAVAATACFVLAIRG